MQEDGFAWWKQRFAQMSCYFDAFRIDHILGFFRIWSIPMHAVEGIMGYFVRALPVQVDEFSRRGIPFERSRYLQPYITEPVLAELFGNDAESVKRRFLNSDGFGNYALKPEFATQRQVEQHFCRAGAERAQPEAPAGALRPDQQCALVRGGRLAGPTIPFSLWHREHFLVPEPASR